VDTAVLKPPTRSRASYNKEEWNKLGDDIKRQILGNDFSKNVLVAVQEPKKNSKQYNICFKSEEEAGAGQYYIGGMESVERLMKYNKAEIANFTTVEAVMNYANAFSALRA
jgi:hypothetical protein